MSTMPMYVYLDPAEAVKRGSTQSGWVQMHLSREDLRSMTDAQREFLARCPGLGGEAEPPRSHRKISLSALQAAPPRIHTSSHSQVPILAEASMDVLIEWIDAALDYDARSVNAVADMKKRRLAKKREVLLDWLHHADEGHGLKHIEHVGLEPDEIRSVNDMKGYVKPRKPGLPVQISQDAPEKIGDQELDLEVEAMWVALSVKASTLNELYRAKREADQAALEQERREKLEQLQDAKAQWLRTHGTTDQVERYEAGVLSDNELFLAIRSQVLANLDRFPRYDRITSRDLEIAYEQQSPGLAHPISEEDIDYGVEVLQTLTADQWAMLKEIKAAAPEHAMIEPRVHTAEHDDFTIERCSVYVRLDWHGRPLARAYAFPGSIAGQEE